MYIYIGLDTATTTGISILYPHIHTVWVSSKKGTPVELMGYIYEVTHKGTTTIPCIFAMEVIHNFLNAVTTRSLLERYGYVKHSLIYQGFKIVEVSPSPARKNLGVKTKKEMFEYLLGYYKGKHLTSDHTDATAVALYAASLDGYVLDPTLFRIEDFD